MKPGVLAEPVLVGRDRELEELMRFLDSVFDGKGTTVFVSGEAGSGKTRLINDFLGIVKEKEVAVLSSWCLSDVQVPYFPFMEAFNAYFAAQNIEEKKPTSPQPGIRAEAAGNEEAEIKAWLLGRKQAEKTGRLQDLTPEAWKDLAVAAVTKALLSISAKKTVILFIDDLHWADSASLSLLHYISRSIGMARILVLATYRSEELSPDAEGRPHPLLETLRLMRREGLLSEIKLPNLTQANVAALAEKMVGGSLHAELADKLADESRGNPLFIVESLRMLSERGSLVLDSGRWRLSIDEVGIPSKIKDIILRRVGMLKPNQRRILDLASVIGERFDVELLGAVLGQDSLEVLETLNAVTQSSSLICCEGSYYEFDHAKSREAIYEEISPPLKTGYHARIAEKMEARSRDAKDLPVNDLAYHYAQAGNKGKAVKYSLDAGEDALDRFSNADAAKHYAYVLEAVSDASEYAGEREKALEGLGDALSASCLYMEATKTFEQLSRVAESGVVKLRALRKATSCSIERADIVHALELAGKAEEYAQLDHLEYARLRLCRGAAGQFAGAKEAFADVEGALSVFEEDYSLPDVATALALIIFFYLQEDRLEDLLVAILRAVKIYEELEDLRGQLIGRARLGMAFGICGFPHEMADSDEKVLKIGEKIGAYDLIAIRLIGEGIRAARSGDLNRAVAVSLKAVEYAEKTEEYGFTISGYANLVRYYAMLGEIKHAEEFDEKAEKLFDEGKIKRISDEETEISKAVLFSAKGQFKEANEIFEKRMTLQSKSMWGSDFAASWKDSYAWSLAKQGRTEEAKTLFEESRKRLEMLDARAKRFEHANVRTFFMARKEVGVGEELSIRLDMVNVAKNHAALVRIEALITPEFKVSALPSYCSIQKDSIVLNKKELGSFMVESLKLGLRATKAGVFTLDPQLVYIDDMNKTRTCKPKPITVTVNPALHVRIGNETISVPVLPGRVATGFADLDALLYGGIPEKYAVMLTSPSTEEREQLISRFLETGALAGETTFHVTAEAAKTRALSEEYPSNFNLIICNPQADTMVQSAPNVFKLKGVENLTDIDIALAKAIRTLDPSAVRQRRICIDTISDMLLQHHAVTTRKWLSALLPTLKSMGFTVLAVIDPGMHPAEETQAVLGLFDGEISIYEKEMPEGMASFLRIRKMTGQKYLKDEIPLTVK